MVVAAHTGFIEIQVPLIDAALFRWYLLSFVLPMAVPAHILGADWGFDQLFCRVAKLYDAITATTTASVTVAVTKQQSAAGGVIDSARLQHQRAS